MANKPMASRLLTRSLNMRTVVEDGYYLFRAFQKCTPHEPHVFMGFSYFCWPPARPCGRVVVVLQGGESSPCSLQQATPPSCFMLQN